VRIPGPWRRFFARAIDVGLWLTAATASGLAGVAEHSLVVAAALVAGLVIYEVVMLAACGTTIGKATLRMRVARFADGERLSWRQSAKRVGLTYLVTSIPLGIGSIVLAVSMSGDPIGVNRGWHDRRAGSVVVTRGRLT
jgi:hypothetical protein